MKYLFYFFLVTTFTANAQIDTILQLGDDAISIGIDENNYHTIESEVKRMVSNGAAKRVSLLTVNSNIDSLPFFIFEFTEIKELHINSTGIISLEASFNKFRHLIQLRINSPLCSISDKIIFDSIENLHIAKYSSMIFPKVICSWTQLREVDIQGSLFRRIPKEIDNLQNLLVINFSDNKLNQLPDEIGALKHLEVLSIGDNDLKTLPNSICRLTKLRELYILNNPKLKITETQRECIKSLPVFRTLFE